MRVRLTPSELAEIIAGASQDAAGMVELEIPDECVDRDCPRLILAHPQIVRYDDRHARLTPTQYAIVRFALREGGSAEFGDIRQAVWLGKPVADKAIQNECSRISGRLAAAGIPCTVTTTGSRVTLDFPQN